MRQLTGYLMRFLITAMLLFAAVMPVLAQEAEEPPQGIDLLLLLVGLGAVVVIGGAIAAREAARNRETDA